MVRFSQNYGVQIVEGLLDYFKKKVREQAAGGHLAISRKCREAKHILYTCAHTLIQVYKRSITVFSYPNFTIWELRKKQMPILIQIFGVLFSDFLTLFFSPKICTSLQNATHINCNICNSSCNKPKFSVTNFFLLHFCYTKCYALIY